MRVKGRLIERASSILEMQKENVILIRYSQRQLEHFCKKKTKKVQNLVDAKVLSSKVVNKGGKKYTVLRARSAREIFSPPWA